MHKSVLFLVFLVVVNYSDAASVQKPLVVASIKPLALLAADLAGDWLDIDTLLSANQEPHHVSLSISQRRKLAQAELVLWVGPGLESFLVKSLAGLDNEKILGFQQTLLSTSVPISPQDSHYWLDPKLVATYYRALADALIKIFPEKSPEIRSNLQLRLSALDLLADDINRRFAFLRAGKIVVDHQAYSYFAAYFHLQIAGSLVDESGVSAGPRTLAELASQSNIRCVVVEQMPAPGRAIKMATTLGVKLVAIDPLGREVSRKDGFLALLTSVAGGFEACLDTVPDAPG